MHPFRTTPPWDESQGYGCDELCHFTERPSARFLGKGKAGGKRRGGQNPTKFAMRLTQHAPTETDSALGYLLYRPSQSEEPGHPLPLILFLHGRGEQGTDLDRVRLYGLPVELDAGRELPALVVAPQCPPGADWEERTGALIRLLDHVATTESIDPARVYLTGLSMGGRGCLALALARPERFAAVACAAGRIPNEVADPADFAALRGKPVWVFHGARDPVVPPAKHQVLVDALKQGGADLRVTLYPDADHDSWSAAYRDAALYEWMFAQAV